MGAMSRRAIAAAIALLLGLGPTFEAPAQQPEPPGVKVGNMSYVRRLVTAESVEKMGEQQYMQLLQKGNQQGALVLDHNPVVQRVRRIAQDLLPHAVKWNDRARDWQWEVNVFRSPTINAFCMPGGKIAIFTGIIDKLRLTDDELAMIMGHEIAHALREHARERVAKTNLARFGAVAVSVLLGEAAGQLAQVGGGLYGLKFGRNDETEADLIGMEIAARAGYDPRAGISLWEKMSRVAKGQPPQWMSTHPSHSTRIDTIRRNLPKVMPFYERATAGK